MKTWFFFIMGFSVLWAWEQVPGFLRLRRWRALLKKMIFEGIELYFHGALLLVIYFYIIIPVLPSPYEQIYPFFFLLGAGTLTCLRGKSELFLLLVFGLSTLFGAASIQEGSEEPFSQLAGMVGLMVACTLLLLGVRWRLRYSVPYRSLEGLPVFFLSAAVVSLALWGFQGILP